MTQETHMTRLTIALLAALSLGLAGCGRKEAPEPAPQPPPAASTPAPSAPPPAPAAVAVTTITIGNAVNADNKVTASSSTLGRKDTVYASVDTTGSGTATLKARWTYLQPGQPPTVVNEETLTINPAGPATTEFHISKPDGWPTGEYQVEIFANDVPAGTQRFTVK
jgi:hypothetical protein